MTEHRIPPPLAVASLAMWALALGVAAAVVIADRVVDHLLGGRQ